MAQKIVAWQSANQSLANLAKLLSAEGRPKELVMELFSSMRRRLVSAQQSSMFRRVHAEIVYNFKQQLFAWVGW